MTCEHGRPVFSHGYGNGYLYCRDCMEFFRTCPHCGGDLKGRATGLLWCARIGCDWEQPHETERELSW